jgi:hypothetical protein
LCQIVGAIICFAPRQHVTPTRFLNYDTQNNARDNFFSTPHVHRSQLRCGRRNRNRRNPKEFGAMSVVSFL